MGTFRETTLRILITCYWITGLCNFYASRPKKSPEDEEIFKTGKTSYAFRIITSLIFFYYGISQFKQESLIYLTLIEIIIVITIYIVLLVLEKKDSKRYKSKIPNRKLRD